MNILSSALADFSGIVTVLIFIVSATVAISSVIDQVRQVRQRATIVGELAVLSFRFRAIQMVTLPLVLPAFSCWDLYKPVHNQRSSQS